jgi:LysM repeat protein
MKVLRLFFAAAILALALSPLASAPPTLAQTNLVANPGFESGGGGSGAANWAAWYASIPKPADGSFNYAFQPRWNLESLSSGAAGIFVYSGNSAQRIINNWDPWWAGVKQVVNVPAGSRVRFTAYVRAWAATADYPAATDSTTAVRAQVGIEPSGSDNQFASSVVWSGSVAPHSGWTPVSVEATVGAEGKVGVFISMDYRGSSRLWLGGFFDEASLVVVGSSPAPAPTTGGNPQPTQPPSTLPTPLPFTLPTPNADGSVIYTVRAGDTGWSIAANARLTLDELRALNPGVNVSLLFIGQTLVLKAGNAPAPTVAPTTAPPPTSADNPTAAPTNPSAEQPTQAAPNPTSVAAANTGQVCVSLFDDVNGNALRDAGEVTLPGGSLTVIDAATGAPVQAYTTQPGEEQHCFENLAFGTYTLAAAPPTGYNPTRNPNAKFELKESERNVTVEFSAQQGSGGGSAPPPAEAPSDDSRMRTALFGAAGIMLLLLAAGLAGFFILRRR